MKQKIVLAMTVISIFLTGCSSKVESTFASDGKQALENHQYEEAMKILSSALEEDGSDEHSRAMYMQARRMLNALSYEESKNYEKAIKELEPIEEIKGGLASIKSEASSKIKELQKLHEEQEKAEQERKKDAKSAVSKDKYKLEKEALEQERQKQQALEKEKSEQEDLDKEKEENGNKQEQPGNNGNQDKNDKEDKQDKED